MAVNRHKRGKEVVPNRKSYAVPRKVLFVSLAILSNWSFPRAGQGEGIRDPRVVRRQWVLAKV